MSEQRVGSLDRLSAEHQRVAPYSYPGQHTVLGHYSGRFLRKPSLGGAGSVQTCATSPARMPPTQSPAVHSVMMLPSSSSMLLKEAYTPPPVSLWQRRTRLPFSVRLARYTDKPPPFPLAALQSAIVQSSSRAFAPEYTSSPPAKMKQDWMGLI